MFKFLKRQRLVQKGMACGKVRRAEWDGGLAQTLENTPWAKAAILALFVAGLALLIFSGNQEEPLQKMMIGLLILATALAQLWMSHPEILASSSRFCLVFLTIFLQLACTKLLFVQAVASGLSPSLAPLLVPYAFAPLVLSVLLGKNHGIYAAIFVSLWGYFLLPQSPIFLVLSLMCGFVATYFTTQVRRRSKLIRAGVYVGLATWLLAVTFGLVGPIYWESLGSATNWKMLGYQSLAAVCAGFGTAIIASGVIPIFESLFGITTDISWLETADLNHPLLRQLSMDAPGTYHHSLAVANLAEAAAERIGANPTICRVCAYFHDVGKLVKPEYFTENMHAEHNPHDDLTLTMSALIVIAHVKEGAELGLRHKLNRRILDVIREHHGTTLVSYFYHRARRQQEDAKLGGKIMNMREDDVPEVQEASFRYPGPKPQTREAAIISLADACESASRAMERPTPQRLKDLIEGIIGQRVAEGQLDECPITLEDIREIGDSIHHTLVSMMHSRIAYPKREEKAGGDSETRRAQRSAA